MRRDCSAPARSNSCAFSGGSSFGRRNSPSPAEPPSGMKASSRTIRPLTEDGRVMSQQPAQNLPPLEHPAEGWGASQNPWEDLLQAAPEIPVGLAVLDSSLRYVQINDCFAALNGTSAH